MIKLVKNKSIKALAVFLALVPFTILCCLPNEAMAQRKVLVKVYSKFKKDGKLASLLQSLFRMHLTRLEGVTNADPAPLKRSGILAQALTNLRKGLAELRSKKWIEAETYLTKAVNGMRGELGVVSRLDLAKGLLGLGVAKGMGGNAVFGEESIKKAFLIYPGLDSKMNLTYGTKAAALIAKGKNAASSAGSGKISVSSNPGNAEIWARGKLLGISPVSGASLPNGSQYIIARLDGHKPSGLLTLVGSGTNNSVTLTAAVNLKKYRLNGIKLIRQMRRPKRKVAGKLFKQLSKFHNGVRDVVALTFKKKGRKFTFQGLRYKNGTIKKVGFTLTLDSTRHTQIQRFLASTLGTRISKPKNVVVAPTPTPLPSPTPSPGPIVNTGPTKTPQTDPTLIDPNNPLIQMPDDQKKKPSILSKWWFWTIIGVAVAGGVTAAILLTRKRSTSGEPTGGLKITFH